MEDADPDFVEKMSEGDIIVAGENFGSWAPKLEETMPPNLPSQSSGPGLIFLAKFNSGPLTIFGLEIFPIENAALNNGFLPIL